jgi:hypothetical protein
MESVDGALINDVTVTNIAMRNIYTAPIFLTLSGRMRGPEGTPLGRLHHVLISNIVAEDVEGGQGILITGLAGHPIQDVTLDNIQMEFAGGGTADLSAREVPELAHAYPEPGNFGKTNSWGLFARHAENLVVRNVAMTLKSADMRPPAYLEDVGGVEFDHLKVPFTAGSNVIALKGVSGLTTQSCSGTPDQVPPR